MKKFKVIAHLKEEKSITCTVEHEHLADVLILARKLTKHEYVTCVTVIDIETGYLQNYV